MIRESILVLAVVSVAALVACKSDKPEAQEQEAQEATAVQPEKAPPVDEQLFEGSDQPGQLPLSAPLLTLLPPDTRAVAVIAEAERVFTWLNTAAWSPASRKLVGEELRAWIGLDLADRPGLEAAGVDLGKPMALAQLNESVFVLVAAVADAGALRKALKRRKGRRIVIRDRLAAIVVGPNKELQAAVEAIEATGAGESLARSDGFRETAAGLNVGKDAAVYVRTGDSLRGLAAGFNLRERAVMAQVALHPTEPGSDWRAWLATALGTSDFAQKPAVADAKIDAIRTVCDAAENFAVNASTLRPGVDPDKAALVLAREAGILGYMSMGGTSKKAKKKRAQLDKAEEALGVVEKERDARVAELERDLRTALGSAVGYARVNGELVVIYGGQFFATSSGQVATQAAALWFAASDRSVEGKKVAAEERKVEKLRDQLHDISMNEIWGGSFASITGTADFSSGLDDANIYGGLLGNEVGEMKGGFGFGLKGTGPGGGGTGWGTIGTGKYGTIGHGGGTAAGYGRGGGGMAGRVGRKPSNAMPKATLQSGGDEVLRKYLRGKMRRIGRCYIKALSNYPKLSGTLDLQLSADEAGAITAHATGVTDRNLTNCVAVAAGGKLEKAAGRAGSFSINLDTGR